MRAEGDFIKCTHCGKETLLWKNDSLEKLNSDPFYLCIQHTDKYKFCLGCGYFLTVSESVSCTTEFGWGICPECYEILNDNLSDYVDNSGRSNIY